MKRRSFFRAALAAACAPLAAQVVADEEPLDIRLTQDDLVGFRESGSHYVYTYGSGGLIEIENPDWTFHAQVI